ncbi:hypothetical protein AB0M95_28805 [Sphaerisporangium sp. NPDC051017]|uniref:hypothetical protein n=1 Tax=Sphaerisporangium sp. NPDC051017 TaxID=3154636 RepID=UPI00341FEE46
MRLKDAHQMLDGARETPELVARVTGHLGCDRQNRPGTPPASMSRSFAILAWSEG